MAEDGDEVEGALRGVHPVPLVQRMPREHGTLAPPLPPSSCYPAVPKYRWPRRAAGLPTVNLTLPPPWKGPLGLIEPSCTLFRDANAQGNRWPPFACLRTPRGLCGPGQQHTGGLD